MRVVQLQKIASILLGQHDGGDPRTPSGKDLFLNSAYRQNVSAQRYLAGHCY